MKQVSVAEQRRNPLRHIEMRSHEVIKLINIAPPPRPPLAPNTQPGQKSPPPAVRVRGYHPRKIFENSDAKCCILVTTCCEISCFLKTTAKKLGTNILLIPNLKVGGPVSRWFPRLLRLCYNTQCPFFVLLSVKLSSCVQTHFDLE